MPLHWCVSPGAVVSGKAHCNSKYFILRSSWSWTVQMSVDGINLPSVVAKVHQKYTVVLCCVAENTQRHIIKAFTLLRALHLGQRKNHLRLLLLIKTYFRFFALLAVTCKLESTLCNTKKYHLSKGGFYSRPKIRRAVASGCWLHSLESFSCTYHFTQFINDIICIWNFIRLAPGI